ncbi:MucB/RseB C-terminal domain-containing protein [Reinekea forsetii]|nr:MucB/RseB C-terminal domain-containing protein [Reinekea forsetii]
MNKRVISAIFLLLVVCSPLHAMEWMWLEKMRLSVQQLNYRGEFMHRRGDDTQVFSIVHRFTEGTATELLRQLDGHMIEVLRQGEKLTCYFPEGTESAAEHPVPAAPFSQLSEMGLEQISLAYTASEVGEDRVAGYMANIIKLTSDQWRYEYRFWLEKETHMLLQSEIIDSRGKVLEQFRFTRLELNVTLSNQELRPKIEQPALVQSSQVNHQSNQVKSDKVTLTWVPSGFLVNHSQTMASANGWTEKISYSDGLTSFSVFVDSQGLASSQSTMAKMGATTAIMVSRDKLGVTVVGEIPEQTAMKLAQSVTLIKDF